MKGATWAVFGAFLIAVVYIFIVGIIMASTDQPLAAPVTVAEYHVHKTATPIPTRRATATASRTPTNTAPPTNTPHPCYMPTCPAGKLCAQVCQPVPKFTPTAWRLKF